MKFKLKQPRSNLYTSRTQLTLKEVLEIAGRIIFIDEALGRDTTLPKPVRKRLKAAGYTLKDITPLYVEVKESWAQTSPYDEDYNKDFEDKEFIYDKNYQERVI